MAKKQEKKRTFGQEVKPRQRRETVVNTAANRSAQQQLQYEISAYGHVGRDMIRIGVLSAGILVSYLIVWGLNEWAGWF